MHGDRHAQAEQIVAQIFSPEGRANPYPLYHQLRELAPVHRTELVQAWLLTGYDDCQAAMRDPRLGRGYVPLQDALRPDWRSRPALTRMGEQMLMVDGAAHTRLRRLVSRAFTARTVERMRPAIQTMVDELLDPLVEAGSGDLMEQVAFPLPANVVAHMLGVPPQDVPPFRDHARALAGQFEMDAGPDVLDAADKVQVEAEAYFDDLIAHKRKHPGEDLISDLLAVQDGTDRLAPEELANLALLLFLAGFETTTNLIGNSVLGFVAHPEQIGVLRAQPELYRALPNELLRYDGTVQLVLRMALEPIEQSDGTVVGAGELVMAVVGAGNRDPRRFADPDRLDVTRPDVKPLSFGGGPHFCLGAALARTEVEIFFSRLFDRIGSFELTAPAPHRDTLTLRGPWAVRLALSPPAEVPAQALGWRPATADLTWRQEHRERMEAKPRHDSPEIDALADLFARVGFFAGCTRPELISLAATAYPLTFEAGEVLMSRGADAEECYVIAEGEVRVEPQDRSAVLLGADDIVGERGPLFGAPRTATVTAVGHVLTWAISQRRLREVIEANPAAADAMKTFVHARQPDPVG